MAYKTGNKYKVMKPMKAKGVKDEKPRLYDFNEIYDGHPNNAEYPAALEQVTIKEKKSTGGKK